MSQIKNFPQGVTPDQKFGLAVAYPLNYNPNKKYMLWIIGHGIGQKGNGSNTALNAVVNWSYSSKEGWYNIRQAVDTEDFIALFLNFSQNYDIGETEFALNWAKTHLPVDESRIFYLGHSLGSFIGGNNIFSQEKLASQFAGWIVSASGNFGDDANLWPILKKYNIRIVGVTAQNDTVMGTNPIAVTRIGDRMLSLDPNYPVTIIQYPSTIWTDKDSHNAVLTVLTRESLNTVPITSFSKIKYPFPTKPTFKMNIYQWAKSNPKGSIPKFLTDEPGAVFATPTPAPPEQNPEPMPTKTVNRNGISASRPNPYKGYDIWQIFWSDAPEDRYNVIKFYYSDKQDRFDLTLEDGSIKQIFKTKTI